MGPEGGSQPRRGAGADVSRAPRPWRCSGARSRGPTPWWWRCKRRRVRFTQRIVSAGGPPLLALSLALLRCRSHVPRRAARVWLAAVATARRMRRRCFRVVAPRTPAVKCAFSCQPGPAHARSHPGPRRALLITVPPRPRAECEAAALAGGGGATQRTQVGGAAAAAGRPEHAAAAAQGEWRGTASCVAHRVAGARGACVANAAPMRRAWVLRVRRLTR